VRGVRPAEPGTLLVGLQELRCFEHKMRTIHEGGEVNWKMVGQDATVLG
jgi:hypothetical protein